MGHADLSFFRALLSRTLERLTLSSVEGLSELVDERETLPDLTDRATQETDRDMSLIMRERDRRLLQEVRQALQRLDNGEYGVCEECGEEATLMYLGTPLCEECDQEQQREHDYMLRDQMRDYYAERGVYRE